MSTTLPGTADTDVANIIAAADQLAAGLATGGLLCGPAAEQDDAGHLVIGTDLRGAYAELDDGSVIAVVATPLGAGRLAGSDEISAVVAHCSPAIASTAASIGRSVVATHPIIDADTMTGTLGTPSTEWTLVGAGIFDGDEAIAAVALRARITGSPDGGAIDQAAATGHSTATSATSRHNDPGVSRNFHLLAEVTLAVTAELGSTTMTMGELLNLQPGGVIELDREAGTPIDVLVNGTLIAKGEVVVVESQYAVRITEVVTESDRP